MVGNVTAKYTLVQATTILNEHGIADFARTNHIIRISTGIGIIGANAKVYSITALAADRKFATISTITKNNVFALAAISGIVDVD